MTDPIKSLVEDLQTADDAMWEANKTPPTHYAGLLPPNRTPAPLTHAQLEAMLTTQIAINHKLHDNLEIAEAEIARLKRQVNNLDRENYRDLGDLWRPPYPDQDPDAQSTGHAAANRSDS